MVNNIFSSLHVNDVSLKLKEEFSSMLATIAQDRLPTTVVRSDTTVALQQGTNMITWTLSQDFSLDKRTVTLTSRFFCEYSSLKHTTSVVGFSMTHTLHGGKPSSKKSFFRASTEIALPLTSKTSLIYPAQVRSQFVRCFNEHYIELVEEIASRISDTPSIVILLNENLEKALHMILFQTLGNNKNTDISAMIGLIQQELKKKHTFKKTLQGYRYTQSIIGGEFFFNLIINADEQKNQYACTLKIVLENASSITKKTVKSTDRIEQTVNDLLRKVGTSIIDQVESNYRNS